MWKEFAKQENVIYNEFVFDPILGTLAKKQISLEKKLGFEKEYRLKWLRVTTIVLKAENEMEVYCPILTNVWESRITFCQF